MAITSLSELRKQRGSFEKLTQDIENSKKGGTREEDETLWSCQLDKAGNGSAVIRFLPAPTGEDFPYVRIWTHGFKGPTGKWYIENSRTTLGTKANPVYDPVTELNNKLWATKLKSNEEIAKSQKRKLNYYSNVLIISDPANPENEGKVKKWRYGSKVFEMIDAKMNPPEPEFEDEVKAVAVNPFCPWDGLNFRLKIVRKDERANFDKSAFSATSTPLAKTDEEIEAIWKKCYSLKDIVSTDKFKSYEDLEKRLNLVLAVGEPTKKAEDVVLDQDDEAFISAKTDTKAKAESKPKASAPKEDVKEKAAPAPDGEEDDLDYFRSLAND